jgi:hypothetical protein
MTTMDQETLKQRIAAVIEGEEALSEFMRKSRLRQWAGLGLLCLILVFNTARALHLLH